MLNNLKIANPMPIFRHAEIFGIIFLLSLLLLCGCITIYNPATGRRETLLIDTDSEVALGRDMDKEIQKRVKLLTEQDMRQRLESVGSRVAKFSDRQDLIYYFRIVKDRELNAFAIPGGFIYVNSGLIKMANDDELAGVIAHEIGHIAARHSVKKLQAALGYQVIMGIVLGLSGKNEIARATDLVFNLGSLGYSRQDELLADKLAVRYSKGAGFNPYGITTFFEKLKKEAEEKGHNLRIEFLSSHPDINERIKRVKEEMAVNP